MNIVSVRIASLVLASVVPLISACSSFRDVDIAKNTATCLPRVSLRDAETKPAVRAECCERRTTECFDTSTVHVFEFNDDGTARRPMEEMLSAINDVLTTQGGTIVLFAHGWHHGSSVCDSNASCFRAVLDRIKREEVQKFESERKTNPAAKPSRLAASPMIGVYVGWRGEKLEVPYLNLLTFWSTKNQAHELGESPDVQRLFGRLAEIYTSEAARKRDSALISVGHSFGGALLFSVLERRLASNKAIGRFGLDGSSAGPSNSTGIGDAVLLVNPAFEAERYAPFAKLSKSARSTMRPGERYTPTILTIASKKDRSVRLAFPVGRSLYYLVHPSLWRNGRREWVGLGHYDAFNTHSLSLAQGFAPERSKIERERCDCPAAERPENRSTFRGLNAAARPRTSGTYGPGDLRRIDGKENTFEPFIVVETEKELVRGHGDIFNPLFTDFLVEFIRRSREGS